MPIKAKKDAERETAFQRRARGDRAAQGRVAALGGRQYVELDREGTDRVFVLLVEFGDERYPDPRFADAPESPLTAPLPQRYDGPRHNGIPRPDRRTDHVTLWRPDYSPAHYRELYFTRLAQYWKTQSSGRFSIEGDVTNWVRVPYNQAFYGRDYCGTAEQPMVVCPSSRNLPRDAFAAWVDAQIRGGKTLAEVTAYLKTFDQKDRYDLDRDGNFDEPDGFIDQLQVIHAGGDQIANDPLYGTDAIWSHRWYADIQRGGPHGTPGVQIGTTTGDLPTTGIPNHPTGVWFGDYTMQAENSGLGTIAHEYAQTMGLPDLYDTTGLRGAAANGGENSVGFWTPLGMGSNLTDGRREGVSDSPPDLTAWELYRLGWLKAQGGQGHFVATVQPGQRGRYTIGPNVPAGKGSVQAIVINLPDKKVPQQVGSPSSGDHQYWSTQGDLITTSMTRSGISGTTLTARTAYDIEEGWDVAFLEASSDGSTWQPVATNLSSTLNHNGFNASGLGITGTSDGWVDLTATLPAGTTAIRFVYRTDPGRSLSGLRLDDIAVDGVVLGDAESADDGWTLSGFVRTAQTHVQSVFNAYLVENRQYDGYDRALRTAYEFPDVTANPRRLEHYPYLPGLLVWYWDASYKDNNVSQHPGAGLVLPVDAHPTFWHWPDGTLMRPRIHSFDSAFGLRPTPPVTLHQGDRAVRIPAQPAVPRFDDTKTWWHADDGHTTRGTSTTPGPHPGMFQPGWVGVQVPATGTTVTAVREVQRAGAYVVDVVAGAAQSGAVTRASTARTRAAR